MDSVEQFAEKGYIVAKTSILHIPDLTMGEKILLMRIASFGEYYESAERCAEVLNFTPATVRRMRRKLSAKGYIVQVNTESYRNRYKVIEKFRSVRKNQNKSLSKAPKKPVAQVEPTAQVEPPVDTSMLKPAKSQRRERNDAWSRWKKAHPELLPALDACTNYLLWRKIPLVDPSSLRRQLVTTSDMFKDPRDENAHVSMILTYIDYLKSDEYAYQVEHTKFCPTITTQDDLFRKFNAIREFKQDESRHYDPRKTLTRT